MTLSFPGGGRILNYSKLQGSCFGVLVALASSAGLPASAQADYGFYRVDGTGSANHGLQRTVLEKANRASLKLWPERVDSPNGPADPVEAIMKPRCSAQFVSDSGHMLTAIHCLKTLLGRNPFIPAPEKPIDVSPLSPTRIENDGGGEWIEFANQIPVDFSFPDLTISSAETGLFRNGAARLLALGKGFVLEYPFLDEEEGERVGSAQLPSLEAALQDFILLKWDLPTKTPCVRLSREPIAPGATLWAVGHPVAAERADGLSSDGADPQVSRGRSLASWREMADFSNWPLKATDFLDRLYGARGPVFSTTIDSVSGNSGGMIIDYSGALRGVVSSAYQSTSLPSGQSFQEPITLAIRADWIYQEVERLLGPAEAEVAFHCTD